MDIMKDEKWVALKMVKGLRFRDGERRKVRVPSGHMGAALTMKRERAQNVYDKACNSFR